MTTTPTLPTDSLPTTTEPKPVVTFTAVKPLLFVDSSKVDDAVSFYKTAFGAEEVTRVNHPKRKADQDVPLLVSAEVKIGGSFSFVVSDISDATGKEIGTGIVFRLETEEIEAAVEKAVKAGAVAEGELTESEGDDACDAAGGRVGKVKDPYGIVWVICTPVSAAKKTEDVEA